MTEISLPNPPENHFWRIKPNYHKKGTGRDLIIQLRRRGRLFSFCSTEVYSGTAESNLEGPYGILGTCEFILERVRIREAQNIRIMSEATQRRVPPNVNPEFLGDFE